MIELYDPFSIVTLCLLEEYGFCDSGQAGKLVRGGGIAPGGELPVNTGGGQLSGFYLQGMTPLAEALIQLRGDGGDRQVAGARTALVTGIGGRADHHEALVLARESRMTAPSGPARRRTAPGDTARGPAARDWLVASDLAPDAADPVMAPVYEAAARGALALPFCAACSAAP